MLDLEHANSLVRMAHKDFNALLGMQGNDLFADEIFGFHVQQAVEKTLKAWLCTYAGADYPMTHELARLLSLLENQNAEVEVFWPLVQYTMFAVQARYEEGVAELDEPIDRAAEIAHVSALLTHVEKLLAAKPLG
ncbi:MAG: HEPN domain-containing protein [Sideroxyarcus sp.]|nr:HEPN domain-containing protein [Sideroxyarcus sp.]